GFLFFSSRRRHTSCSRDWSSDVSLPILFGLNSTGFILAAQFNGRLLRRRTPLQLLRSTTVVFMVGTLLLPLIALMQFGSLWPLRSEERRVGKEYTAPWPPWGRGEQCAVT